MKMSLSGWLQRGMQKLRPGEPPPERTAATIAAVGWVDRQGIAHSAKAKLGARFEGGIDLLLDEEITVDTPLWLISDAGFDKAAVVHFCSREQNRYTVRVSYVEDASGLEDDGAFSAARMKWTEGSGRVVACGVSIRSGKEGELTVSMAEALPAPAVVLLTGGGYQCLGAVESSVEEQGCWVAQVQVISEAYPRAVAQAA